MEKDWRPRWGGNLILPTDPHLELPILIKPHICKLAGYGLRGVRAQAVKMARANEWPPDIPIFRDGTHTLFRDWMRHMWLESRASLLAMFVLSGDPGMGKSALITAIGRCYEEDFDMDKRLFYEAWTARRALKEPDGKVVFLDEGLAKALWSAAWDPQMRGLIKALWTDARANEHIVGVVTQHAGALKWEAAELARWWIDFADPRAMRNVQTGAKLGFLYHSGMTAIWTYKKYGGGKIYKMDQVPAWREGGIIGVPGISPKLLEQYKRRRAEGLAGEDDSLDYEAFRPEQDSLSWRPSPAPSSARAPSR